MNKIINICNTNNSKEYIVLDKKEVHFGSFNREVYMEFFDKLGQKASEAYKVTANKTGKIAKEAKLKMKMGELKSEINNIYEDIGKIVYEKHIREDEYDISKEVEEKCIKIDILNDEIESHLKNCLELKDKKQCPNCYTKIEKCAKFCQECGTKQENEIEETEKAKDVENVNKEDSNNNQDKYKEKSNLEKTVEIEADVEPDNNETVEYFKVEDDIQVTDE